MCSAACEKQRLEQPLKNRQTAVHVWLRNKARTKGQNLLRSLIWQPQRESPQTLCALHFIHCLSYVEFGRWAVLSSGTSSIGIYSAAAAVFLLISRWPPPAAAGAMLLFGAY